MQNILLFIPNIEQGGIEKNLVILSNYFFKENYNVEVIYGKISPEIKNKINKNLNNNILKLINIRTLF